MKSQQHHIYPRIKFPASLFDIPRRRPSSAKRGYGWRWRKERKLFLAANRFCLYCWRQGRVRDSELIDHSSPHKYDSEKFWDKGVWTPCCRGCHSFVSAKYDGGAGNPIKPRDDHYLPPSPGEVMGFSTEPKQRQSRTGSNAET